jgi:hypothetical protein
MRFILYHAQLIFRTGGNRETRATFPSPIVLASSAILSYFTRFTNQMCKSGGEQSLKTISQKAANLQRKAKKAEGAELTEYPSQKFG